MEKTLQRLGSKFEVVPLTADSAFVKPASILYELDGALWHDEGFGAYQARAQGRSADATSTGRRRRRSSSNS